MTGVKTLLAVVPDVEGGLPTLETACIIGRDLACHVRVLHVRPDPSSALPLMGEAMSGAMIDQMMATCEKEGTARAVRVRGIFDQLIARYDIPQTDEPPGPSEMSAAYIELIGQEDEAAVSYGRMADVVVIGRPQDGDDEPALQATLNAVLMETGRPVIVAPRQQVSNVLSAAVIAWNGSVEAVRAVAGAIPLLLKSSRVVIAVAGSAENLQVSASELQSYLAWHGIDAELRTLTVSGASDVGPSLLRTCDDVQASLLVMGAYTHSRLRQLIIGGVTRHVLDNAHLPVLLAH